MHASVRVERYALLMHFASSSNRGCSTFTADTRAVCAGAWGRSALQLEVLRTFEMFRVIDVSCTLIFNFDTCAVCAGAWEGSALHSHRCLMCDDLYQSNI